MVTWFEYSLLEKGELACSYSPKYIQIHTQDPLICYHSNSAGTWEDVETHYHRYC